jgi:hypothetical protein
MTIVDTNTHSPLHSQHIDLLICSRALVHIELKHFRAAQVDLTKALQLKVGKNLFPLNAPSPNLLSTLLSSSLRRTLLFTPTISLSVHFHQRNDAEIRIYQWEVY